MKVQRIILALLIATLTLICSGCVSVVSMPYSSIEYEEMNWSLDELVAHFEELGFTDIKIDKWETFDKSEAKINRVAIEDITSNSWFTDYKNFEKGEEFSTTRKVYISAYTYIPTLTVDNCADFAEIVMMDDEASEKTECISLFMREHNGEYIEFDGTITHWNDNLFFIQVNCTIAVEDSEETSFSWDASISELGLSGDYHYEKYHTGLITEGMKVHVIAKIDNSEEGWALAIDSMQIIE